jgi:hypothetical protein
MNYKGSISSLTVSFPHYLNFQNQPESNSLSLFLNTKMPLTIVNFTFLPALRIRARLA